MVEEEGLVGWLVEEDGEKRGFLGYTVYGAGQEAVGELRVGIVLKEVVEGGGSEKKVICSSSEGEKGRLFLVSRTYEGVPPEMPRHEVSV